MGDRTVSVWLKAQVADYVSKMDQASDATKKLKGNLADANKSDSLNELGRTALVTGGVLTAAFLAPVKAAADFDKAMSNVSAATHAGVTEMDQLRKAALQAGADTSFSAVEAAQGVTELAKAGVKTADILGGGLRGALDLAAAGELSVAEASETAATAMTQFHLSGKEIPHLADLLAAGAGKAQGEVHDMAAALKMGGLVAAQFGINVDDTVGTLAAFAHAGLIGSDAGTSFKTMLLHLSAPSKVAAAAMHDIGLEVYDTSGQFIGMERLAGALQDSLAGLTQEQRNQALATIFGTDAVRAANVLYEEGAAGVAHWRTEVTEAGYATDTANRKLDNLGGDLEKLKGSIEVNLIKAGGGANDVLRGLVQNAEGVVNAIGGLPEPVMAVGVGLVGVAGAALLVGGGLSAAVVKMHDTRRALEDIQLSGTKTEKAMVGVAKGAGKVAVALAVTQVVGAAVGSDVNPQLVSLTKGLTEWAESGKVAGETARLFGDDLQNLNFDLKTFGSGGWNSFGRSMNSVAEGLTGLGSVWDKTVMHAKERMSAYDQALAGLVQSGRTEDAAKIFAKLGEAAKAQGISIDDLKKMLPGYSAAVDGASKSQTDAIKITQDHEKANRSMNGSMADAIKLYGDMKGALDALNGEERSFDRALNDAESAVDDLSKAVKEHGGSLDRTTEAGRANRELILKGTEAAEGAAQATYDHNVAKVGEAEATILATKMYQKYIDDLKKSLPATKENQAAWDEMWAAVGKVPPLVAPEIKVVVPPAALPEIKALDKAVKEIKDRQIEITEKGAPDAMARAARLEDQMNRLQDKRVLIIEQGAGPAAVEIASLDGQINALRDRQVIVAESGAADSEYRVQQLEHAIGALQNKKVTIEAEVNARVFETRTYLNLADFQNTHGNLRGGIYTHAQQGLVNAGVYPAGPTQYAFAEAATGGEIFAPKFGDLARTRSIIDFGVNNWWGGSVAWNGSGASVSSGGGVTVHVPAINIYGATDPRAVAREVAGQLRDVARRADLMKRSG